MERTIKTIAVTFGTIILGAIGSGVWEKLVGPLFDGLTELIIDALDFLIGSYKDSIYREAAFGYREYAANGIYELIIGAMPALYLILLLNHPKMAKRTAVTGLAKSLRAALRSAGGFYVLSVITLFVFSYIVVSVTRLNYTNAVVTFAEGSIDILAPYISEDERRQLLSDFRRVTCKEDYYKYYAKLVELYKKYDISSNGVAPL